MKRICIVIGWVVCLLLLLYLPEGPLFARRTSINVFCWGDIVDPALIAQFEQATGIRVKMSFYSSNEELLVKLKATGGKGYDLIIPSDYAVARLIQEKLLKPLDHSLLPCLSQISPRFLNLNFDPNNHYSVPFEWELFLIGIDRDYFHARPLTPSWDLVFNIPQLDYHLTMSNDPVQSVAMASYYLWGPKAHLSPRELAQVVDLLIQQKPHVNAYADARADYFLATRSSQVVVCSSAYLWRAMKKFPWIGYVLPKEGTFITLENFCIPKKSTQEHLTYQLINFLCSPSSMMAHYHTYGTFPTGVTPLAQLSEDPSMAPLFNLTDPALAHPQFFGTPVPQDELRNAWVQVKTGHAP